MNELREGCFYLRSVEEKDKEKLFVWANDKEVRNNSFCQELITEDEHSKWFDRMMSSPETIVYILMMNEEPIGQCRLTVKDGIADLDYSIDRTMRGNGIGKLLIDMVQEEVYYNHTEIQKMQGRVKPENYASIKCFKENDYDEAYYVFEKRIDRNK